jgi:hypothetical protein
VKRSVSSIAIYLTNDEASVKKSDPGYQAPIDQSLVSPAAPLPAESSQPSSDGTRRRARRPRSDPSPLRLY